MIATTAVDDCWVTYLIQQGRCAGPSSQCQM